MAIYGRSNYRIIPCDLYEDYYESDKYQTRISPGALCELERRTKKMDCQLRLTQKQLHKTQCRLKKTDRCLRKTRCKLSKTDCNLKGVNCQVCDLQKKVCCLEKEKCNPCNPCQKSTCQIPNCLPPSQGHFPLPTQIPLPTCYNPNNKFPTIYPEQVSPLQGLNSYLQPACGSLYFSCEPYVNPENGSIVKRPVCPA